MQSKPHNFHSPSIQRKFTLKQFISKSGDISHRNKWVSLVCISHAKWSFLSMTSYEQPYDTIANEVLASYCSLHKCMFLQCHLLYLDLFFCKLWQIYICLIYVQHKPYNLLNHVQMPVSHDGLRSHKNYGKNNLKIMHVTCSQSRNLTPCRAKYSLLH